MWRRRYHPENTEAVVVASVDLLEGNAPDLFRQSEQSVPAWAYVNALAHSHMERLSSLKTPEHFVHSGGWDAVLAYLATELVTMAHERPEELSLMQRAALVPLELALLAGQVRQPETPRHLAELVVDALHPGRTSDRRA